MTEVPSGPRARGSILVYAVAFGLLVVAGLVFVVAAWGRLSSVRLLWVSAAFSAAAIVAAVLSLAAPRR